MLDIYEELKILVAAFERNRVEYALCGGMAMAVYGVTRATIDIDILVPTESLDTVLSTAMEHGYVTEAKPMVFAAGAVEMRRVSKRDPETADFLMLDIILVTPPLREVWNTRKKMRWEEGDLCVASREGLIGLKSLRHSGQDKDDIERLKEEE